MNAATNASTELGDGTQRHGWSTGWVPGHWPGRHVRWGRMRMERLENGDQTMYVQVARQTRCDGTSLTLVDLAPSTVYLADQPTAALGHLPTGQFLDDWYSESAGAATRTVPAVLSLLDADRVPGGDIPTTSGASVLFIRPFTRPASLMSPARTRH
jgi:hypothetical protein